MKIATYNINSVNAHLENLCNWLKQSNPDIVLLQEIKCEFNNFPFFDIQSLGYNCAILGQKSYNGVAILSRGKLEICHENLPDFPDEQSRYLEANTAIDGTTYKIASIYLPNGNPPYNNWADTSKFDYKLRWMDSFLKHMQTLVSSDLPTIIGGDFNTIMTMQDVYNYQLFEGNALCRSEVQNRLKQMSFIGFYDAFRALHSKESGYTFWDYTNNSFQADFGMRIDYFFTSPLASDKLTACYVDKTPRANDKPSDHTALIAEFK